MAGVEAPEEDLLICQQIEAALVVVVSFASSVTLINSTKWIYVYEGFKYPFFVTMIHSLFSYALAAFVTSGEKPWMRRTHKLQVWEQVTKILPFTIFGSLSIACGNAALVFLYPSFHEMIQNTTPFWTLIVMVTLGGTSASGIFGMIIFTGVIAAVFNLSAFLMVARLGALTAMAIGNLKNFAIIFSSVILFGNSCTMLQVVGFFTICFGVWLNSQVGKEIRVQQEPGADPGGSPEKDQIVKNMVNPIGALIETARSRITPRDPRGKYMDIKNSLAGRTIAGIAAELDEDDNASSAVSSARELLNGENPDENDLSLDNCCPRLSYRQRFTGWACCFAIGTIMSLAASHRFKRDPGGFARLYTLGNLVALSGSFFLMGPAQQLRRMMDEKRRWTVLALVVLFSATISVSILMEAERLGTRLLIIVLVILQYAAMTWDGGRYRFGGHGRFSFPTALCSHNNRATSSLFAAAFSVVKTKTGSKVHHQNQYQNKLLSMNQNLAGTTTKYKDRLHLHDYLTPPDTNTIMSQQSGNRHQPFSELQIPPVPALKEGNKKICDTFVGCYRVPENLTITVDAARFVPEPDNPNKPPPLPFPTTPEKCATYCYETGLWPEMVYIADAGNTCLCSVQGPETEELRREFGVVSNTVCRKASCEEMSVDDDNIGANLAQTYEKNYPLTIWSLHSRHLLLDNPVDNVCRCDFGHGATGVDCQVDNVVKCMDCHDGYHLNETDPHAIHADCEENHCTCENGQGATNRQCPTHDLPKCVACNDHNGYTLDHEMCRLRQCTCKDGTADIGIPCEIDGHASCASCDPGYWLPNGTKHLDGGCQRKQCTCHNGFPTNGTACPAHNDEFCAACDPGYYLLPNNTCALKVCTCANGVNAEGVDCPTNAIEFCTACDEPGGYVLEENKCNRRHCTCEHGKERWGLPCTVDGEHQCASCDAGFALSPGDEFSVLAAGAQDSICAGTAIQSATGHSKFEANAVSGGYWSLKTCEALCENEPACGFLAFSEGKLCALFEQCMHTALHRGAVVYKKASFDVDLRSQSGKSDVTKCGSKACVCAHGTPTSGAECPAVEEEFCDKCDRGYHMEGSFLDYTLTRRCDENACTCPHGTGARVEECEKHGALKCVACDEADGFFLEDHHCRLRKCSCDNGVGEVGKLCSEEQNHECHPEKCQPGHYFKNTTTTSNADQKTFCPLKECSCEHGLGFKGIQCETL
eukprot:g7218.t1